MCGGAKTCAMVSKLIVEADSTRPRCRSSAVSATPVLAVVAAVAAVAVVVAFARRR